MTTVLHAFLLFTILLVLALLLGQAGMVPIPVVLQLGTTTVQTTAPVAITLGLALLLVVFYLGRLTSWMTRLPKQWFNRKQGLVGDKIADAYTALALGNVTLANQLVTNLRPDTPAHADLIQLVALQSPVLPPLNETLLTNPRTVPLTALVYARTAAAQNDWVEVRRLTTIGRQSAPENSRLLVLQFKALVNLNDPATSDLLPSLKPLLGHTRHKLLSQIISGPTALTASPTLDNKWVKSFEQWLPTASDIFPE